MDAEAAEAKASDEVTRAEAEIAAEAWRKLADPQIARTCEDPDEEALRVSLDAVNAALLRSGARIGPDRSSLLRGMLERRPDPEQEQQAACMRERAADSIGRIGWNAGWNIGWSIGWNTAVPWLCTTSRQPSSSPEAS